MLTQTGIDRRRFVTSVVGAALPFVARHAAPSPYSDAEALAPKIDGAFWTVARNPDLGALSTAAQQPVDFAIWQAADSTWQLWSCIRFTRASGRTRLFFRWQARRLIETDWEPMGIALEAAPRFGETEGGLQAPFVIRARGVFYMFYGDWENICLASSADGKTFTRQLTSHGKSSLFSNGPGSNTRDPMVLAHGGRYYCYSTSRAGDRGAVYCRISNDLRSWGAPKIVSAGGSAGTGPSSAECPFVYHHKASRSFYLFRTHRYGGDAQTCVYRSNDPLDFGVNDDRNLIATLSVAAPEIIEHDGRLYLACLHPALDGIRIAPLRFA
jgi:hypothetical protein